MTVTQGGQAVYGAPIGILMLDARFARVPGDMGNAGHLAPSPSNTASYPAQARNASC